MKICYISNSAIPSYNASSLQIIRMCDEFVNLNHDVQLICPDSSKIKTSIYNFYNLKNKFSIKELNRFKSFPLGLNFYLFSFFSIYYSLKKKFDVYITRNFFTAFCLTLLRKKIIFEIHHDLNIEGRMIKIILSFFNFLNSKHIIKIVAISKAVKSLYVKEYNVNSKKILILPSGTNIKLKFQIKNNKKLRIGYLGSLNKEKSLDLILKIAKLDNKNTYHLYGNLENNFKPKKLKNLFINAYVPYMKIPKILYNLDILLLPYNRIAPVTGGVGNVIKYTSPLKLFDYIAAGKLVISSNLSVIKEILTHNKNSILIKNFSNPISWINEIKK